ncbi:hypothetical protein GCM10008066_17680 [Oxalicibacterium faecigallinarum]|uniref:Conserved hypothetical protein CHP02391 domain-containing protein n=1 Tax=Oxalicibacterium faecigallinarum TaxID=573741 RepID=A0A8J3AQM9_9BURK|nr:hypothetical protein GCM10008066_17680 [Oxalicibacterium faecigallinarum]
MIEKASLVTSDTEHAFVLKDQFEDTYVIKAGFASGYSGEGSRGLAVALALLYRHKVEIEEYKISADFMHRIEFSCLLSSDLEWLENTQPVRPQKWYDYMYDVNIHLTPPNHQLVRHYPLAVPYRLIDERIIDLAVSFHEDEDRAIMAAYRRLEDVIRIRTEISESGAKLFSRAFLGDAPVLTWDVPDDGEIKGRAGLFTSVFMAFRNARMHREPTNNGDEQLNEFMLINELFRLEACAIQTPLSADGVT